jgi:gliding motility-associated-like protein
MVWELPSAIAGEDEVICEGAAVTIGGVAQPGYDYHWTPSDLLSDSESSSTLASPNEDTQYTLTVTDQNGCQDQDTVTVYLNKPTTLNIGGDHEICLGDSVQLGGNPTASGSNLPYAFSWSPSSTLDEKSGSNPWASPLQTTIYTLITRAGSCVIDTSSLTVTVHELPVIDAGIDRTIGFEEGIQLSPTGAEEYTWYPQEFFEDDNSPTPFIYPNRTREYWVVGQDHNGCSGIDTLKVTLKSELFIPTLFTPNGDGENDVFYVHGFGIAEITLQVFDRWGRLLFETNDPEQGWDGTINGSPAEEGEYLWVIQGAFYDGDELTYQGKNGGIVKLVKSW